jgi:hypothetical protein
MKASICTPKMAADAAMAVRRVTIEIPCELSAAPITVELAVGAEDVVVDILAAGDGSIDTSKVDIVKSVVVD